MRTRFWVVLVALVSTAAMARAQPETQRGGPAGNPRARGEVLARRDEAFRMVDAYVISQLQESLELGDAQFGKVVPLVTRLQTDRREYFLGRARLLREMRRLLRAGGASEAQVLAKLDELKRLETDGPARTKRDVDALDAALTPLQQAKYRLLELEVEQRMRELMGRARGRAPGRAQPGE